ncbi:MAG TPA: hypothetical protein VGU20_13310 [Stellaceae bacterium]|nr:hypothetical protein [Stellaceae bacterium]
MIMGRRSHLVPLALAIGLAATLGACGSRTRPVAEADTGQRQAIERARNLCQDLGYIPGTVDFARCAQSEYDRWAGTPPVATAVPVAPTTAVAVQRPAPQAPQAAAPAPSPTASPARADDEEDWLVRWFKRPNYCQTAACTVR